MPVLGLSSGPTTGRTLLAPHVFDALGYGVKADAVTRIDGAMTSGSAVLTASGFTSADIGKTVVVNNAVAAGSHLYTTIVGYTSSTQVTLNVGATNTVSATPFSYGTNDTTAWQQCVADAQAAGAVAMLPPTPMLVTAATAITGQMTVVGHGCRPTSGQATPNGSTGADAFSLSMPVDAPFLDGSVLVVAAPNVNGVIIDVTGRAVNLYDFGVYFAGQLKNTGHGFRATTSSALTSPAIGLNTALDSFTWERLYVFGHDGTHYAYAFTNCILGTLSHIFGYGGGGLMIEQNSNLGNYGNYTVIQPYFALMAGPAHAFYFKVTQGGVLNLMTFIRPQANDQTTYKGTRYAAWGTLASRGKGIMDEGAARVGFISADIEDLAVHLASGISWYFSPDCYVNQGFETIPDGAPFMHQYGSQRRINRDGSVSTGNETAGSSLWLLNDLSTGVNGKWEITTDGTAQMRGPAVGTTRFGRGATGSRPSASTSGAGAQWYDSTLGKPIWSDGTNWKDASGATV